MKNRPALDTRASRTSQAVRISQVKRAASFLSVLAFVFVLLGAAAAMAAPLFFQSQSHAGGAYATSESLAEPTPVATSSEPPAAQGLDAVPVEPAAVSVPATSVSDTPGGPEAAAQAAALAAAAGAASPAQGPTSTSSNGAITIVTFGHKYGPPPSGCKLVADVRNIEAGPFDRSETGLLPSVRERVMATPEGQAWLNVFKTEWIPALKPGDTVAIGCSIGHHRSVSLGVILADELTARGYTVNLVHRDITKG
jgi:hypothetical protein